MPCGIFVITAIPDDKIGLVKQEAELDAPTKMSSERHADGTWNVTLTFPPCQDGSDPLQTKKFDAPVFSTTGAVSSGPQAFIQEHLAAATQVKRNYKVPIAVTLAQAALETRWGRSVVGNAFFGIKAGAGQKSITTKTHEVRGGQVVTEEAAFRSYSDFDEAADDYGKFLTTNPRYQPAFQHPDDPEQFARAVAVAGFATDPNYGDKLVSIMTSRDLQQLDQA